MIAEGLRLLVVCSTRTPTGIRSPPGHADGGGVERDVFRVLDFGAVFGGGARWMAIGVRPAVVRLKCFANQAPAGVTETIRLNLF